MIVVVCSDKGSPGVTTLATALALQWPGRRVVLEADTSGADLPFRVQTPRGEALSATPSVLSLAADTRSGLPQADLLDHAQQTAMGMPVIPGALSPEGFSPMRNLWSELAAQAAAWDGLVIADLGRLQPGHAALPMARSAEVVLLLARSDLGGLYHLRDRATALSAVLGDPSRETGSLAVVMRADAKDARRAGSEAQAMLQAVGSPIPVAGVVVEDPTTVRGLSAWDGGLKVDRCPLLRSVSILREQLLAWWPDLSARTVEPATPGDPVSNTGLRS